MDPYLNALKEPVFIVSALFSLAVAAWQPKIIRITNMFTLKGSRLITKLIRCIVVRHKRKIKKTRWNSEEITFQSIRTHTYFGLFIGSIFFYLYLIILGPLRGIGLLPYSVQLLIYSPNLILEAIWILQHAFTRELIDSRAKIRIKSKRNLRRTTFS